jgi:predicted PurR-regulated permease PerM
LLLALAAVAIGLLVVLRSVVVPLFFAVLLAAYLRPVVKRLQARGVPKGVAAGLGLLLLLVAVAGIAALTTYAIVDQADTIRSEVEAGVDELEDLAEDTVGEDAVDDARSSLEDGLAGLRDAGVRGAVRAVSTAVEIVAGAIIALFALFYVLRDGDKYWARLVDQFGDEKAAFLGRAGPNAWRQVKGYMFGTAAIAAVDAVLIGAGAAVLSVPSALAIAILTFFTAFIPYIGALVAGAFAVVLALADGGVGRALAMLAVVIVVQQIEGNLLQPLIQSRFVALHPLTIILAVTAGGALAGVLGMLIAVPIIAVGVSVFGDLRESGYFDHGRLD